MIKIALLLSTCICSALLVLDDQVKITPLARVKAFEYDGTAMHVVSVKDLEASKRWYAKALGSTVHFEMPDQGWCELSTPCEHCFLGLSREEKPTGSGSAIMSFGVRDIAKAQDWLKACGAQIDGDVRVIPQTVKLLYFADPDGNKLLFYEPFKAQ